MPPLYRIGSSLVPFVAIRVLSQLGWQSAFFMVLVALVPAVGGLVAAAALGAVLALSALVYGSAAATWAHPAAGLAVAAVMAHDHPAAALAGVTPEQHLHLSGQPGQPSS